MSTPAVKPTKSVSLQRQRTPLSERNNVRSPHHDQRRCPGLSTESKRGSALRAWVAEKVNRGDEWHLPHHVLPITAAVLLTHVGLFILLMNHTTDHEITLANTAPPASVRVTMVAPPPPELPAPIMPKPTVPQVLTNENAERTIAQEKRKPVEKPIAKPIEKPKATPTPGPKPVAREPQSPTLPTKAVTPQQTNIAAPANNNAAKMLDLPSAGPKDVQTIGCRVPAPEYPRKARRMKLEGNVLVRLVIDASGQVQSATVAHSSGDPELDDAARKAVMGASCSPYIENGRAIAVSAAQPVSFRLSR